MISLLSCPNPGAQARFFQVSLTMPIRDEVGPRFLALSRSKDSSCAGLVVDKKTNKKTRGQAGFWMFLGGF